MKTNFLFLPILLGLCSCQNHLQQEPMTINYQSQLVQLPTDKPQAFAQIDNTNPSDSLQHVNNWTDGFTITISATLDKPSSENVLLEIPQMLKLSTKLHDPADWVTQNYPSYPTTDGDVPVLEASLWLEDEAKSPRPLTVGLPLSLLENPYDKHNICLQFTGVRWSIYVDNRLYDNDFAIGYPSTKIETWKINAQSVDSSQLFIPALALTQANDTNTTQPFNIQFWTPRYHNAWVGDVATFYHNERYHIFYLFDRRGHASKFGKGGHYFEHLSTTDFRHWTEHEAATPIEHQWESFGTGTPFIENGQLCLSYGLHTTRIYSNEHTTLPMQWKYLEENGNTGSFRYDTIANLVPAGSTYAISQDGVSNFKKTHLLIHPCENPSIYTTPDGSLQMLANYGSRGTWESDSASGGWKCINADFPPGGDCTFPFHWNNHDYIIGGFSRLWYKDSNADIEQFTSMVQAGIDFYNGMSVPSITEIANNRFLMAGWIKTQNWGGPLAIHELIQHPDGQIGSKWMSEIVPATTDAISISSAINANTETTIPQQPFILSFEVHPQHSGNAQLAISLLNQQEKQPACEWQMQINRQRAQFAPDAQTGFEPNQKTLREGGDVSTAQNYAIENGMKFNEPFTVRMLINPSAKMRGTLMDVEIGAQRTMLSYRPNLFPTHLQFHLQDVHLKNITYAILK